MAKSNFFLHSRMANILKLTNGLHHFDKMKRAKKSNIIISINAENAFNKFNTFYDLKNSIS